MNKKFLGLGSNEGNRREFLNKTLTELNKICEIVKEKQLANPAIIIIGEVVKERVQLTSIFNELNKA